MQEMLLGMLRNPFFKLFLLSPTLRYLVKKLQVDLISPFLRGSTGKDIVIEVGKKIREQWKLVTFARIRFYRGLAHDQLITEKQLQRLEKQAERIKNVLVEGTELYEPASYPIQNSIEPPPPIFVNSATQEELRTFVILLCYQKKPTPLPWELDPDFFEKHHTHKRALLDIQQKEHEIAWYDTLWNAMVDGLQ